MSGSTNFPITQHHTNFIFSRFMIDVCLRIWKAIIWTRCYNHSRTRSRPIIINRCLRVYLRLNLKATTTWGLTGFTYFWLYTPSSGFGPLSRPLLIFPKLITSEKIFPRIFQFSQSVRNKYLNNLMMKQALFLFPHITLIRTSHLLQTT